MTATYTNFGQPEKPVTIPPGTLDPLSLIFAIRMYRLIPGDVLEIPVTDGKRVINAKAIVASRETVTINHDVYDTLLVIPDLSRLEGIVSGRGEPSLKIWFTTDERHLPVKIQTRIAVGSLVFELVSAHRLITGYCNYLHWHHKSSVSPEYITQEVVGVTCSPYLP